MIYLKRYMEGTEKVINKIPNIDVLRKSKILITGSNGLIGSAIIDILIHMNEFYNGNIEIIAAARNEKVLKKRFEKHYEKLYFSYVHYDIGKGITFDIDVDYVIHCAGNAHPSAYEAEPVETIINNIHGLNDLLEYVNRKNIHRFLYVSSSEIYGNGCNKRLLKEEDLGFVDILNSRSCYPSSKRVAETLCISYIKEYCIDAVIVRPGHIYGPTMTNYDSRASAQFIRNAVEDKNIIMKSSGEQLRSYCYVLDCASAVITVLINGNCAEVYNISNKNSIITIKEFAYTCAAYRNKKLVFENPTDVERNSYNMMKSSALDATKLEGLGWNGVFSALDGIEDTINILCENALINSY